MNKWFCKKATSLITETADPMIVNFNTDEWIDDSLDYYHLAIPVKYGDNFEFELIEGFFIDFLRHTDHQAWPRHDKDIRIATSSSVADVYIDNLAALFNYA